MPHGGVPSLHLPFHAMSEPTFNQLRDTGIGVEPHEQCAPEMQLTEPVKEKLRPILRGVSDAVASYYQEAIHEVANRPFDWHAVHGTSSPLQPPSHTVYVREVMEELVAEAKASFRRGILLGICIGSIPSLVLWLMYLAR